MKPKNKNHSLFKDDGIHKVFHEFCKKFYKYKRVRITGLLKKHKVFGNSKYHNVRDGWKYAGYKLMQEVEKFAEKYPKDIEVVNIDDSCHASSSLVLIHHIPTTGPDKGKNWGTTAIVVTQCDGQPPCEFFMYPGHQKSFISALRKVQGKAIIE